MNSLRNFLVSHVKHGYKSAVKEAKHSGRVAAMYIDGADYVKSVLGIEGEYTAGEEYVTMIYEQEVTVAMPFDNGEVSYEVQTTNYLLRSSKRDNRCSLTLEYGQLSHTIAEVTIGIDNDL